MVGVMNRLITKGLPLLQPSRAVRYKNKARYRIARIFLSLLILTYFVSGVPVRAIETTKASALVLEEASANMPLSFTHKSPHTAQKDPCLSLLHTARLSPGAHDKGSNQSTRRSYDTDKKAASVALGFFLGVRVALGPKEVVQDNKRVQIGPEVRTSNIGRDNYALAVAAYRSCKNKVCFRKALLRIIIN